MISSQERAKSCEERVAASMGTDEARVPSRRECLQTAAIVVAILASHAPSACAGDWGYENSSEATRAKPANSSSGTPADWGYDSSASSASTPSVAPSRSAQPVPDKPVVEAVSTNSKDDSITESIPQNMRPGMRFELTAVTRELHAGEQSFAMPHWLGGSWQCESETKYPISGPLKNGVKHTRREVQTYGVSDGENGWLYAVKTPRVHKIDEADFVEYRIETAREFPTINDQEVVTKYRFYAVQVSKFDGLIVSTRLQKSTACITPLGKSEIQITGTLVSLDTEDNRERSRSVLKLKRIPTPVAAPEKEE